MDLIERLNDARRKLYCDGDEHDVCDTIAEAASALEAAQMGLRYAVRVWVLSDEIEWSEAEIDEVVESIISDAKKEAGND